MNVTHKLTIDLLARGVADPVHAVQCDANTRAVAVTLTAGGVAWEPPEKTTISVAFKKPDGKKGWYDKLPDGSSACSVSANVVTAILAPEVLTAAGKVDAVIVFQDKDLNQLATFGFVILVEPNPAAGRGISNDYYAYSTMEDVSKAVDAMLDSLEETKADIGQLILQVSEAVSQVQQEAGPAIVCQETGAVIAVADSSDRPVQGLKLFGKTVQNGTPSPNAPVELESVGAGGSISVTVAGKNLLKTPLTARYKGFSFSEAFPVKSGADYTLSFSITNATSWRVATVLYDKNGNLILDTPNTTTTKMQVYTNSGSYIQSYYSANDGAYIFGGNRSDKIYRYIFNQDCYVVFGIYYGDVSSKTIINDSQLEIGTAATAYEPYKAQALTVSTPNGLPGIPVTSGGNYTDESGRQWICDEVDFARGVYVQRVLRGEAGASNFTSVSGGNAYALILPTAPNYYTTGLCTHAKIKYSSNPGVGYIGVSPNGVLIFGTDKTTLEDFRAWLGTGKIQVLVPTQAEPIETPLSAEELAAYAALHTNKPSTTVHNDGGAHMELSYVADTKLYIDNKFTELAAAIVSNA